MSGLAFEAPGWLILPGLLALPLLVAKAQSYADLPKGRARLAFGLRLLGLSLLILALARPVLSLSSGEKALVFVVDVSASVDDEALRARLDQVARATAELGETRAGIILFGERPVQVASLSSAPPAWTGGEPLSLRERALHATTRSTLRAQIAEQERKALDAGGEAEIARLRAKLKALEAWRVQVGLEGTDVAAALRLARGTLPRGAARRVILISDGRANRGDFARELEALREEGVELHTWALRSQSEKPEIVAEALRAPNEAQVKAPFDLELVVRASQATRARVTVYRNKFRIETREVDLRAGLNVLNIPKVRLEAGFHEFEARIAPLDAAADTRAENNVARAATRVAGKPRVLIIERNPREIRYLEDALREESMSVEVRPPLGLPQELNELLDVDALILSDVPADAFQPAQLRLVERYVKELGGGLLMLGGEQSFGLGGYYRTPIEDALPVRMPIKKDIEKPSLALLLVIDKSGSMDGEKIQIAREAAIASAEVLKASDQFGVVAFDSLAQWICPLVDATEKERITSSVSRLVAGGGTNIYRGLYKAYKRLLESEAKLKHIILLSDGHTQGSGYRRLVSHIAADEITLSTVGIGAGADKKLLSNMAEWGGGAYYHTEDFASIPQIFTRETLRASKSMLIEEPFVPQLASQSPVLKGLNEKELPFLLGYVATQRKPRASLVLVSEYGDPVLATWSYGLGRSAAFTSDAKTRWAGDWIAWSGYAKFWGQLVRSVMATGGRSSLSTRTQVRLEDGKAHLQFDVRDQRGEFRDEEPPQVFLSTDASGTPRALSVRHTAPGVFEAEFPLEDYGRFHRVMVAQRRGGRLVESKVLAVSEAYSPEFRGGPVDEAGLAAAAERTGGVFDSTPAVAVALSASGDRVPHETWWWWLLAGLIVFPCDLAARRLSPRGGAAPSGR
ncbi:MAG: VWA domain-containing protein [Planctomycetes bacterium]|nr:VWA domain-containing protein [Planctomycetota bacterium]